MRTRVTMREEGSWFRSREQSIGYAIILLFGAFFILGQAWGEAGRIRIVGVALGIAIAVLATRLASMGVFMGTAHVRIRNPVRTHTVERSAVRQFRVGTYLFFPRIAIAELKDGRSIPVAGIAGPPPATRPRNMTAENLADRLNDRLLAQTDESSAS